MGGYYLVVILPASLGPHSAPDALGETAENLLQKSRDRYEFIRAIAAWPVADTYEPEQDLREIPSYRFDLVPPFLKKVSDIKDWLGEVVTPDGRWHAPPKVHYPITAPEWREILRPVKGKSKPQKRKYLEERLHPDPQPWREEMKNILAPFRDHYAVFVHLAS